MNELNEFDFDTWMDLAKKDPEAFEKKRQSLIKSTIDKAPEELQQRLTGLQWTVDCKIKASKNPLDACVKISQMMMDSVYEEGGLLEALTMTGSPVVKNGTAQNIVHLSGVSKS